MFKIASLSLRGEQGENYLTIMIDTVARAN